MSLPKDTIITTAETQIVGFGYEMGVELIIKATTGKVINITANTTTVQLTWTDTNGSHKVAQVLTTGTTIDSTTGKSLGIYYPTGKVFADANEMNTFMGSVTAKIANATVADA